MDRILEQRPPSPQPQRISFIKWTVPANGKLKANVAVRAYSTNSTFCAGGILRDSRGNCIAALGQLYLDSSSHESEILMFMELMEICAIRNVMAIEVETTSPLIFKALAKQIYSWKHAESWGKFFAFSSSFSITPRLAFPETNSTAVWLATQAGVSKCGFGMSDGRMNRRLQALLILDLVCPHVRLRKSSR